MQKNKNIDALISEIRCFWYFTYEPEFSQIWCLSRKSENCYDFPFRLLAAKSNVIFYNNSNKTLFWQFLCILSQIRTFVKNPLLSFFVSGLIYAEFLGESEHKFQEKLVIDKPTKWRTDIQTSMSPRNLPNQESKKKSSGNWKGNRKFLWDS